MLDAGILSLHFVSDARVKGYFDSIADDSAQGSMSSINLSEFHYKTCQKLGKEVANVAYYQIRNTKLHVVETSEKLTQMAALEKCRHRDALSLADCYALALAKNLKATLLTTDGNLAQVKDVPTRHVTP